MFPRRIAYRKNGRRPQNVKTVPFHQVWNTDLKNQLSRRDQRHEGNACLTETLAFLTCLKDNDNLQAACVVQAQAVQKCYESNLKTKAESQKQKITAVGDKKVDDMSRRELNKFLSNFPHKLPTK